MQAVTFKNRSIDLAGNLYLPPNFDRKERYAAIVAVQLFTSSRPSAVIDSKIN